jgi:hypothetical protein
MEHKQLGLKERLKEGGDLVLAALDLAWSAPGCTVILLLVGLILARAVMYAVTVKFGIVIVPAVGSLLFIGWVAAWRWWWNWGYLKSSTNYIPLAILKWYGIPAGIYGVLVGLTAYAGSWLVSKQLSHPLVAIGLLILALSVALWLLGCGVIWVMLGVGATG